MKLHENYFLSVKANIPNLSLIQLVTKLKRGNLSLKERLIDIDVAKSTDNLLIEQKFFNRFM